MAQLTLSRSSIRRLPRTPSAPYQSNHGPLLPSRFHLRTCSLWVCSNHKQGQDLHKKHIRLILNSHHRAQKPHPYYQPREQRTIYPDYHYQSWRSPQWGWGSILGGNSGRGLFDSGTPETRNQAGTGERTKGKDKVKTRGRTRADNDFLDWDYPDQMRQTRSELERIKKEIDKDPYQALFGKRLEPFDLWLGRGSKLENGFSSFCRSWFGFGDEDQKPEKTEEKKKGETVDKDDNVLETKIHTSHGSPGDYDQVQMPENLLKAWETERLWSESPGFNPGYQFDPISGRMVEKSPEPSATKEGSKESYETSAPTTEFDSKRDSKVEKPASEPQSYSEPALIDGLNKESSLVPEVERGAEGASEPTIATQCQTTDLPPIERSKSTPLEEPHEAGVVESQAYDQYGPMPPDNFDDAFYRDGAVQPKSDPEVEGQIIPEKPIPEKPTAVPDQDGLDRLGFLSRRDAVNSDKDLESLRASDIRAAYEPRRQSIESELEAEVPKGLGEASSTSSVGVEDAPQQSETPVSREEMPHSTSSANPLEQALTNPSHHEATTAMEISSATETYRIFAYDPSSFKVAEAETNSSLEPSSDHEHPTDVLTRLSNPAKFLPCLKQMHSEGYEIVSGGGDILVFRRGPKAENSTSPSQVGIPPNYGYSGTISDPPSSPSQQESAPKSGVRKVLGRMLFSGFATASTCYAIGVVCEYFATGGEDGWGFDGFTVFESERRHRD